MPKDKREREREVASLYTSDIMMRSSHLTVLLPILDSMLGAEQEMKSNKVFSSSPVPVYKFNGDELWPN